MLYWRDRNLRWHRYDRLAPSPHVEPLLAEIEADPTSIFWGQDTDAVSRQIVSGGVQPALM